MEEAGAIGCDLVEEHGLDIVPIIEDKTKIPGDLVEDFKDFSL